MQPTLRLNDGVWCICGCPLCPICPPGVVISGSPNVFINDRPAARIGDLASNCCGCCCPCPNYIITGSTRLFINDRPAATISSHITCGFALSGSVSVLTG